MYPEFKVWCWLLGTSFGSSKFDVKDSWRSFYHNLQGISKASSFPLISPLSEHNFRNLTLAFDKELWVRYPRHWIFHLWLWIGGTESPICCITLSNIFHPSSRFSLCSKAKCSSESRGAVPLQGVSMGSCTLHVLAPDGLKVVSRRPPSTTKVHYKTFEDPLHMDPVL